MEITYGQPYNENSVPYAQRKGNTDAYCCSLQFYGGDNEDLEGYNPYMDFGGHLWFTQVLLYAAVPLMML